MLNSMMLIYHHHTLKNNYKNFMSQKTVVEWLAEKYNYVTWMRNRDEISAGIADEWRKLHSNSVPYSPPADY